MLDGYCLFAFVESLEFRFWDHVDVAIVRHLNRNKIGNRHVICARFNLKYFTA